MRAAQRSLAGFVGLLDWAQFQPSRFPRAVQLSTTAVRCVACSDAHQAVVWLVRPEALTTRAGRRPPRAPLALQLTLSGLEPGAYQVYCWDTQAGFVSGQLLAQADKQQLTICLPALQSDVALAVVPAR
jgi:mannan endo-1,4-beta-mannosidase